MNPRTPVESPPRPRAATGGAGRAPAVRPSRSATLRRWRRGTLAAAGVCLAGFLANVMLAEVAPDNAWGLTYGTLATLFMVAVAAYGIRRRTMQRDYGRSRTWLLVHVYGGGIFLLLVFMHSGFAMPRGPLNTLLWVLSIWVSASGAVLVLLQKWIPRMLSSGLSMEAVFERIPSLVEEMRLEAEAIEATASEPVRRLYERSMAPAMRKVAPRAIYFLDITGGIGSKLREWDYVSSILSEQERPRLDRLRTLYRSKTELDAQYTLQRTLRWWLYTHVPASVVLVGAVAIHLYAVWRY
jgi:hypothetical protein